jgi:hypothetical protein
MSFDRGLAPEFLKALVSGVCRPVSEACDDAGLDVRIRDNYINAYSNGQSVAKLEGGKRRIALTVHHKYLPDQLGPVWRRSGKYRRATVTPSFAQEFAAMVPDIVARSRNYTKTEHPIESRFLARTQAGLRCSASTARCRSRSSAAGSMWSASRRTRRSSWPWR